MKQNIIAHCPVCGYGLDFLPWDENSPADEICESCGIQFGLEDIQAKSEADFLKVYEEFRKEWIKNGAKWFIPEDTTEGWDGMEQLKKYLESKNKVLHIRRKTT